MGQLSSHTQGRSNPNHNYQVSSCRPKFARIDYIRQREYGARSRISCILSPDLESTGWLDREHAAINFKANQKEADNPLSAKVPIAKRMHNNGTTDVNMKMSELTTISVNRCHLP